MLAPQFAPAAVDIEALTLNDRWAKVNVGTGFKVHGSGFRASRFALRPHKQGSGFIINGRRASDFRLQARVFYLI